MIRPRRPVRTRARELPPPEVGAQAERTSMSWQRTALGLTVLSVLLLRHGGSATANQVPGLAGLALAVVMLALAEHRYATAVRQVDRSRSPVAPVALRVVSAGVTALAVAAFVLVLLGG